MCVFYNYNVHAGAVYFFNLDPALRSRLEEVNLVALFKSDLLANYSLDDVLKPFIDDLHKLNTKFCSFLSIEQNMLKSQPGGWSITINDQYNFEGVAFVGAVNMVGGYKEGVSMAMRKCRQLHGNRKPNTNKGNYLCDE